jgi:methylenetetrahydrofolate reductase (NADPH)
MGALASASILLGAGIEPILQFTCRDRNRIALQSDLMGAAALGVRNLLVLTGDDPKAGDQPDTKPVFDIDSRALIETARRLRDQGELPTGRKVAATPPSSSAPPICRSTRPPAGSRNRSPARSPAAPSSCRRSSAWTQRCCAVT